jgi:TRAP-type C4-dicarboxylate transport system substrate-binding protein
VQAVLINKDSWNKISPSDQKIIKSLVPDFIQCNIDAFFAKDQPLFPLTPQLVQDNKVQFIKASDADIAAIQKVQAGQADKWAADQEKAGLPGNKVLADYRALVAKYAKISTFAFK